MKSQEWADGAAIVASLACLAHCLAVPMLLLLLPMAGAWIAMPEAFHLWALLFALPTSAIALWSGYLSHQRPRPALVALSGLAIMGLSALVVSSGPMEIATTLLGACTVAIGHAQNWRAARRAAHLG